MRKRRLSFTIPLLMPLLMVSHGALADGPQGYLGIGGGAADSSLSGVESSAAFRLDGGLRFSRNYGVEAGYIDFGSFDIKNAPGNNHVDVSGPYVALAGFNRIGDRVELTGKLGAMYYDQKVRSTGFAASSDNGTSVLAAIGVNFYFNPAVALGAEFTYVDDVENEHISSSWLLLHIRTGAGMGESR